MKKVVIIIVIAIIAALIYSKPWQKSNLALYSALNSEVLALECQSLKDAEKAARQGVNRFAVQVSYRDGDLITLDGKSFGEFFEEVGREADLIWLNIVNLSTDNSEVVYAIFNSMDFRQERTYIESSSPGGMHIFESNGWHTIYTIGDDDPMAAVASELEYYGISGVAYPVEADEYVRTWVNDINFFGISKFSGNLSIYPHFVGVRVTLAN